MRLGFMAPFAACLAAASLLVSSDADACGGCFIPPSNPTVVSGHRMALAISTKQTVLWDQIQYAGDPAEFAWVLPVKEGAYIELSTDAWFETLDAATNVNIVQPPVSCDQPASLGCGFAESLASRDESSTGGGFGPAVDILHRGTVGPYETVTLSTKTPGALNDWLTKANFAVDPATQPTIDAYVAEGFDFIALKLQPEKDVREMKPVRIITPGAGSTLPLRMVAVGTGPEVAITLYVLAEGRFEADNFPNARVPVDLLAWDFADNTSNYGELRKQTLNATEGKRGWLTTYARLGPLLSPVQDSLGARFFGSLTYSTDVNGQPLDTIAEAYLNQGIQNKETALDSGPVDEAQCTTSFAELQSTSAQSSAFVEDPCPQDAPPDDPTCTTVDPNKIDARTFGCGALDDLSVAMTGSHPRDMWVTRLEAALPQDALKTDLIVRPAKSQETVDHWIQARIAVNADLLCGSLAVPTVTLGKSGGASGGGPTGTLMVMWLGGLALAAALARRVSKGAWELSPVSVFGRRRG